MKSYRAYLLDKSGRIANPSKIIQADDDAKAIEIAKQLVDGHDVEVWDGQRRITKLTHDAKGDALPDQS